MKSFRLRRLPLAGGIALCLAAIAAATGGATTHDGGPRHVLPGTKPAWTSAVAPSANLPASQQVQAKVWLAPRNSAQLDALAQAVSDPENAQYGQFITADQYTQQFAPTDDQVAALRQWLTGAGVSIDTVGPDNTYLAVSGSASAVNAAFGTQLSNYVVGGNQEQAPSQDVSVPTALASTVLAVTGLSTLGHRVTPDDFGAPPAFVNGTQCSSYYAKQTASSLPKFNGKTLPFAPCGYVPSQFRGAYGVVAGGKPKGPGGPGGPAGKDGSDNLGDGQTVAITDAFDSSTLLSDANTYAGRQGDHAFSPHQFADNSVPENASLGAACGGNGWYGEQTLDVEAVHGMAPAANVLYYGASSCNDDDLLASLVQVVHDNKASIVTNSWGEPTFIVQGGQLYITIDQNEINAYEAVFKRGAVQGIGFYFSSGDNGDEQAAWGYTHPDWPTGDPWVTSVGGTSLAIGQNNGRQFETGWGTEKYGLSGNAWIQTVPFLYGSGGGFSQLFPEPGYQKHVVQNDPNGGRAVPDIAMDGDPTTGMLIGETQSFPLASRFGPAGTHYGEYRVGGTSLASPLLAGVQADAQQGHQRIGFANPRIYQLANQGPKSVYYDVTPTGDAGNVRQDYINGINDAAGITYSVRTFDQDSSLTTGNGWDDVTGVGSVTSDYIDAVVPGKGPGH